MVVALALTGAILYGLADFSGGFATKRSAVTAVVTVGQTAGLVVVLLALLVLPGRPDPASLLWGGAAGVAGGLGLVFFYRSLATGTMSIVAPITALTSAAVPVIVGLALGERPAPLAVLGIVLALVAVVLVSAEGGRLPRLRSLVRSPATGGALGSGALFGLFFVFVSRSGAESGLWPFVGARVASILLAAVIGLIGRQRLAPAARSLPIVIGGGIADMAANVLFLLATRQGLLSIAAVLIALYPAATVVLARTVLHEHVSRPQLAGFVAAAGAVTLIAVG